MNQSYQTSPDYKQEIQDILKLEPHRIGSHSDDYGGESDKPCYCTATQALTHLINKARKDELKELLKQSEVVRVDGKVQSYGFFNATISDRIKELEAK